MFRVICVLAAVSFVFYSCDGKSESTNGAKQDQGTILARVNDHVLTYEELQYQFPRDVRDKLRGADLQEAVETWINTMLAADLGRKMGLDKDPAVRAAIEFRTADAIARQMIDQEIGQKATVSQSEIDSVYQVEKDSFKLAEDVFRASHIMVQTKDEADAIYNRLQKGDDFTKLAADYSIHRPSAESGGDIGFFTEEQAAQQIDPAFAKALETIKPGEISRPIQTKFGYHIIKLIEKQAAGSSYDSTAIKGRISEILTGARQEKAYGTFLDSLRKEAKIERYPVPELEYQPAPDSQ